MTSAFKVGSYYFFGNGYNKLIKVVGLKENGVVWQYYNNGRTNKPTFTKFLRANEEYQSFITPKGKIVYSWNISNLHELRKNNFLKNLSKELHKKNGILEIEDALKEKGLQNNDKI